MSLENSQMQQPADLGSEASFGQENASRDLPSDPTDIQNYLRNLKEKQMANIERVYQNHHSRLESSERELTNSMREIQILQSNRKNEKEEMQVLMEKARQEKEYYQKILSARPSTVEEIKEKVRVQQILQQRNQSQQNMSFSQNQILQLSQISKSPTSTKNRRQSLGTGKSTGKRKGTLWFLENREKAEFEYALRDFLKEKEKRKSQVVQTPKDFRPIIIKPEEKQLYERVKENEDYEVMTPCSDELSNYAFETGNDILANFQQIFENTDKKSSKNKKKKYRIRGFKDDELLLIAYFFKKIPQHQVEGDDQDEDDYVTKEDFEQALLNKREILLLYNIKPEDLNKELLRLSTRKSGYVSLKEAGEFLMRDRQTLSMENYENIQRLKQDGNREILTTPQSVLTEGQINTLKDIFLDIDTFGDLKISLKQIIHKIKTDHRTRDWVEKPIAYIKKVDRTILMEELFSELEQWMSLGKEQERRQKELVDWESFKDLFIHYKKKDIPSRDKVFASQRLLGRYDFGDTIEIPKEFLQILKKTFEYLPKYATYYVNSNDFIEEVKQNKQYNFFKSRFVREKKYVDLEIETVDDVLKRMQKDCDTYHTQDELLDFFSRKGRPKYLARNIKQYRNKKILMKSVKKQEEQQQEKESDDSFELDRQDLKEKRKQRKVARILQCNEEDAQKQLEKNQFMHEKSFGAQHKNEDDSFLITVPQPFNFDTREKKVKPKSIRQRRLEEMLQEKQDIEDYYVSTATMFRANKIPKHIKNKKLWSQIMKKNDERREQVKKESKAITLSRENPFSFYYRDLQKVMERKQFEPQYKFSHFKAKHAPWYCRVRLLDRIMERQREKSRLNVEKRKTELAQGSRLPEGVRSMLERLKVKDQITEEKRQNRLKEYSFQPPRAKSVPDFQSLQQDFEDQLRERKQGFEPTIPVPFAFQETRKAPQRDYLDKENLLIKKTKEGSQQSERERKLKKILTMKVKYQPPSTKKFESLVAKKRFEQEMRQYQKEVTQTREEDKNERRKKFSEFVNSCIKNVNYSEYANQLSLQKQQEREARLIEKAQWEQQFDQKMTEMMQNVIRRPLLIEQVSQNNLTSDRAQRLRQILGEGVPVDEEGNYEDEDMYIPNFDQMTEQQLRSYLDPTTVEPQTLEFRKQLYLQYYQKNNQMPNINEMDEEDEDQLTNQQNQEGYEQEEGQDNQDQHQGSHEEERDNEAVNKMNQQYQDQGDYQQYHKDGEHDEGEEDEEDDYQNNKELIEQQKQVQQIQQQQIEDHEYEIEDDQHGAGSSEDYEKVYGYGQNQKSKNQSADLKQQQNQQSVSSSKINQSSSSAKGNAPVQQKSQVGIQGQQKGINQNDDELDEEYDEEHIIVDENGQPIPPHLIKEYQEQMRLLQENEEYGDEYDDDEEFDENIEYQDEEGNPIPREVVLQIKEEQRAQKQLKQQMAALQQQQKPRNNDSSQQVDSKNNSQQQSANKSQSQQQTSLKNDEKTSGAIGQNPIVPQQEKPATELQKPSQSDKDKYQMKEHEEDDDENGHLNEEDLYDEDAEYVDEEGNPLSPEQVAEILKHQKMQMAMAMEQGYDQDEEQLEYVDEEGNPLSPEEVAEILKHQKMMQAYENGDDYEDPRIQQARDGAYPQEEFEDDEDEEYQLKDQKQKEQSNKDKLNQQDKPAKAEAGQTAKNPQQKVAGKPHEDDEDMGEYDEEEPQFENQEEYIEYLVQEELKRYKAAGKKVSEEEVRAIIEQQLMAEYQENEQMEAMDEQLNEAISQMTPEELAQFVDESGKPLSKDQIKFILMQEQLEGDYDENEEYDEEELQQMQMKGAQQKGGQRDPHNSSF